MTVTIEAAYQHPSASMKQWANTQSQAILAVVISTQAH